MYRNFLLLTVKLKKVNLDKKKMIFFDDLDTSSLLYMPQ